VPPIDVLSSIREAVGPDTQVRHARHGRALCASRRPWASKVASAGCTRDSPCHRIDPATAWARNSRRCSLGLSAPCRASTASEHCLSYYPPPLSRLPTSALWPCQLILDGGVRRGVDIAKALALGADGVAIGKPYLYGLAAGGRVGVHKASRGTRACSAIKKYRPRHNAVPRCIAARCLPFLSISLGWRIRIYPRRSCLRDGRSPGCVTQLLLIRLSKSRIPHLSPLTSLAPC
jgi:hypothetical protein